MNEDITTGLQQWEDPHLCCLAYCRKLHITGVTADKHGEHDVDLRHEELWRKVQQSLGEGQVREYTVSRALRHSEVTTDWEMYLQKLSDDFVSDVKRQISQSLEKTLRGGGDLSTKQLVCEVQHHATLAKEVLGPDDERLSERFSRLFSRLQLYVKDPRQSCRPFVIHGQQGSELSVAMSTLASTVPNWLSASTPVTILRFIGTSTDSVDVQSLVASVRTQIQMAYGMDVLPASESLFSELTTFRAVLAHVSETGAHDKPLVLLIDGLEGLQPHSDTFEALWAVRHLPANVYLIMSVTVGSQKTGNSDTVNALLALITDSLLTYDITDGDFTRSENERSLSTGLSSTLDSMEADYGPLTVKYFATYVAVMNVGILDSELYDLLVTNDQILAEHDQVLFTPGIISILRHRLSNFLATRLIYGSLGFSWSKPEYRQMVAERYGVIVGGAMVEDVGGAKLGDQLSEESTNFTLTLHRSIVNLYQDVIQKSSDIGTDTSIEMDSDSQGEVRTTLDSLNHLKANRLFHHMHTLLPMEGLDQLKSHLIFNLDWLMTRLATSSVFHIINDVLTIYNLGQDMHRRSITTDSYEDIGILFEFLQLSSKALSINHLSFPVEVVTRLGSSSFVRKYSRVAELVSQSRRWLADTKFSLLVPLWPVWDRPGGRCRHVLDGVSHVVGTVDGGAAVVGYSRSGVTVWNAQTGLVRHHFVVRPEQPVSGVIAAHGGVFVIMSCYSHITETTELTVLSTETGLRLLSVSLRQQLEAVALSQDDQLFAVSALMRVDTKSNSKLMRSVVGIHMTGRDVVFQLPLVDVHAEGINIHCCHFCQ